ncbi:MAG: PH domain-containing protein [Acidobacteriota bacterium]
MSDYSAAAASQESAHPVLSLERPHARLMTYYVLRSILTLPLMPVVLPYLFFRYHTMRYRFDEEGVSQRWGILFRREISLTYSRLQDIHLASNVVERWLGLARVQLQTASGSSKAEMTIEGLLEYEEVRDFLYSRMRGVKASPEDSAAETTDGDPLVTALESVADELSAVRSLLEERGVAAPPPPPAPIADPPGEESP